MIMRHTKRDMTDIAVTCPCRVLIGRHVLLNMHVCSGQCSRFSVTFVNLGAQLIDVGRFQDFEVEFCYITVLKTV